MSMTTTSGHVTHVIDGPRTHDDDDKGQITHVVVVDASHVYVDNTPHNDEDSDMPPTSASMTPHARPRPLLMTRPTLGLDHLLEGLLEFATNTVSLLKASVPPFVNCFFVFVYFFLHLSTFVYICLRLSTFVYVCLLIANTLLQVFRGAQLNVRVTRLPQLSVPSAQDS